MLGFRRIKRVFSLYLFFDFEMKQLCVFFLSFSCFFFLFIFFKERFSRYRLLFETLCLCSFFLLRSFISMNT